MISFTAYESTILLNTKQGCAEICHDMETGKKECESETHDVKYYAGNPNDIFIRTDAIGLSCRDQFLYHGIHPESMTPPPEWA